MNGEARCPIWGTDMTSCQSEAPTRTRLSVDSPRAGGKYFITDQARWALRTKDDTRRARLTSWLVEQRWLGMDSPEVDAATVDQVEHRPRLSVHERADRLLRRISSQLPSVAGIFVHYDEEDLPWQLAWSESIERDERPRRRSRGHLRHRPRPGGQRRGRRPAEDHRTPPAPPREAASDRRPAVRVPAYGPPGGGAAPPGRILGPRVRRPAPRIRVDGVPLGSGPRAARPPSRSGGRIAGAVPGNRETPDLSDPARSWPEHRGRRTVRPPKATVGASDSTPWCRCRRFRDRLVAPAPAGRVVSLSPSCRGGGADGLEISELSDPSSSRTLAACATARRGERAARRPPFLDGLGRAGRRLWTMGRPRLYDGVLTEPIRRY